MEREKVSTPDNEGIFLSPRRLLLYAAMGQTGASIPIIKSIHMCDGKPLGPHGISDLIGYELEPLALISETIPNNHELPRSPHRKTC